MGEVQRFRETSRTLSRPLAHPSLVLPPVRERHHKFCKTELSQVTLTLPSCTQTKYNKDPEAPCEPGTLRDPQHQVPQARGKLEQPTGKTAVAFAGAYDFNHYSIYSYLSHRMAA